LKPSRRPATPPPLLSNFRSPLLTPAVVSTSSRPSRSPLQPAYLARDP
jgi:hypothetical protein